MNGIAKRILIVVAKVPASGQAKTRLGKAVGMDAAAALYESLLLDVLDVARCVPNMTRAIAYTPAGGEAYFAGIAPDFKLLLQQGDDLGARLDDALATCLKQGFTHAAVMSSDTPLVDPSAIDQAFALLDCGHDVVLGPCDDGGYYLMAIKQPQPGILRPIQMSTPRVLQDTLDAAAQHGLQTILLPATCDIDTADDLLHLHELLAVLPPTRAMRTRAWLQQYRLHKST